MALSIDLAIIYMYYHREKFYLTLMHNIYISIKFK